MLDISEFTREVIREQELNLVSYEQKDTLMDVFRKNHELWVCELFPLLRILRKNNYEFLADLLHRCGYEVSASQVGLYLSKVKKEKNTRGC